MRILLTISFVLISLLGKAQQFEKETLYPIGKDFPLDTNLLMDFSINWEYEDTDTLNKYKQKVEYFIFKNRDTIQLKRTYKPPFWTCIKYSDDLFYTSHLIDMPPHRDYYSYLAWKKDTSKYQKIDNEGYQKWLKEEQRKDSVKAALKKQAYEDEREADSLNQVGRNEAEERWENYVIHELSTRFPNSKIDLCVNFDKDSLATVNFRIVFEEENKYFGYDMSFYQRPLDMFQVAMHAILSMRRKRRM